MYRTYWLMTCQALNLAENIESENRSLKQQFDLILESHGLYEGEISGRNAMVGVFIAAVEDVIEELLPE